MTPGFPSMVGFMKKYVPPKIVPRSMVFNGVDQSLTKVMPSASSSLTTATISFWIKHNAFTKDFNTPIFFRSDDHSQYFYLSVNESNVLTITGDNGVSVFGLFGDWHTNTNWHHYVLRFDTTQATAANRLRLYHNGSAVTITDFLTTIPLNYNLRFFQNSFVNNMGSNLDWDDFRIACKMAFIDVTYTSLGPGQFAETVSSVWTRKKYAGSFGTNGFSLDGSATIYGQDVGPNGLHYTVLGADGFDSDLPPYITAEYP